MQAHFHLSHSQSGAWHRTPPPDNHVHFTKEDFDLKPNETFDPVPSDSEHDLYLIKNVKRKVRAWPCSDHSFETEKPKIRKPISRLKLHLEKVKLRHKPFMKDQNDEILDSGDELTWSWIPWLNPQDGKSYIRARATARAGRANIYRDEAGAEKIASDMFGGRQVGNFNLWLEPPDVSGTG